MLLTRGKHGRPEVIGDYGSRDKARQACELAAHQVLGWHGVPVPGMEGAEVPAPASGQGSEVIYGVLERA